MNKTHDERIVITGMGCVLPGSDSVQAFRQRVARGESAIAFPPVVEGNAIGHRIARIDEAWTQSAMAIIPGKLQRFCSPCSAWGLKAAIEALLNAGITPTTVKEDRRGIFTAQGDYTSPSMKDFTVGINGAREQGELTIEAMTREFVYRSGLDQFGSIRSLANNQLAIAGLMLQLRGDCGAFVQDDGATSAAMQSAVFSIRHDYSDVALLICTGSHCDPFTLKELQTFVAAEGGELAVGEGAIALVIEKESHAKARGAKCIAVIEAATNFAYATGTQSGPDALGQLLNTALTNSIEADSASPTALVASLPKALAEEMMPLIDDVIGREPVLADSVQLLDGLLSGCPVEWLSAIEKLRSENSGNGTYKRVAALSGGHGGFINAVTFAAI